MTIAASDRRESAVAVGANPFPVFTVLAIVVMGTVLFVALLWMIGTGTGMGAANDGKAHAEGKGLNGYAAMAAYLERRGYAVRTTRNPGALSDPGLLILTPPAVVKGGELTKIVDSRRYIGPTMVIMPKWQAYPPTREQRAKARKGWVRLEDVGALNWPGFLDQLSVSLSTLKSQASRWTGAGIAGVLPDGRQVMSGAGAGLVRIVSTSDEKLTLVGYMDDGGRYPGLEAMARDRVLHSGERRGLYPLILVFEPDLVDNYGLARFENARLAEALVHASGVERGGAVTFDMTLPGYAHAPNLLTLAFTPPFLSATLCLLLAAFIVGWRAFLRFGPPVVQDRAIAFGKQALVRNAAGFVRRSGRLHLLGPPYAERARRRLSAALGLPRVSDPAQADAAIDRALLGRTPAGEPFSVMAARLSSSRRTTDLLRYARDIHALERMLTK